MSRLSNRQNIRLGGLIAVLGKRVPYKPILDDLLSQDLVEWKHFESGDNELVLTTNGINEKDRLAILAGLMVEEKYVSNRAKNIESINRSRK